ncbi:DUF226 domain-containing protein [Borrelia hispanica]|uniref:DUF226 domain-containing protein n=1 Tax=Borrelia hispanica TaxID=40835 RepID=UPI0004B48F36|nr:DUF226 domain-containing protein [Borrelia hispanica]
MSNALKLLKQKKLKIKLTEEKAHNLFIKAEEKDDKKVYHTEIMTNSYKLEVHKSHKHRFTISFKELLTQEKVKWFGLFAVKDNNKFLDISYSYRKSIKNKNVVKNYKKNKTMQASIFSKRYYIKFKFNKNSFSCYLKRIDYLLRIKKSHKKHYKFLIETFKFRERNIYVL